MATKRILKIKWYLAALIAIAPHCLFAQKIDWPDIKKDSVYYWGELHFGLGYGNINLGTDNSATPGGMAYGLGAAIAVNHTFLKAEAFGYNYVVPALQLINYLNNSQIYSLSLGRQFPIVRHNYINIAVGAALINFGYQNAGVNGSSYQKIETTTSFGIPIEISYTHLFTHYFAISGGWHEYYCNEARQGNITVGIILGHVRER